VEGREGKKEGEIERGRKGWRVTGRVKREKKREGGEGRMDWE
jgi:hypothetical protein